MAQFGEALLHVARWVGLGAVLIAAGAGVFFVVVWRRSATVPRPAVFQAAFVQRWRRVVVVSWIGAVLGSSPLVIREAPVGVEALRLGLLLLGGLVWVIAGRAGWPHRPHGSAFLPSLLGLTALLALLLSAALSGHAR
ncbi:MAG TPA: hypothetical protein VGR13_06935, partial [Actinomycetota bacterium]|nr:hypothetical protein [Actinomycetota bacterium]